MYVVQMNKLGPTVVKGRYIRSDTRKMCQRNYFCPFLSCFLIKKSSRYTKDMTYTDSINKIRQVLPENILYVILFHACFTYLIWSQLFFTCGVFIVSDPEPNGIFKSSDSVFPVGWIRIWWDYSDLDPKSLSVAIELSSNIFILW